MVPTFWGFSPNIPESTFEYPQPMGPPAGWAGLSPVDGVTACQGISHQVKILDLSSNSSHGGDSIIGVFRNLNPAACFVGHCDAMVSMGPATQYASIFLVATAPA